MYVWPAAIGPAYICYQLQHVQQTVCVRRTLRDPVDAIHIVDAKLSDAVPVYSSTEVWDLVGHVHDLRGRQIGSIMLAGVETLPDCHPSILRVPVEWCEYSIRRRPACWYLTGPG